MKYNFAKSWEENDILDLYVEQTVMVVVALFWFGNISSLNECIARVLGQITITS